ncbi:MAG TPA: HD domain-containing protein [Syntrophomonadaceae bacterium]|nr:HD domain-containing protein [Syntrophomonadaceae bacterium]
MNHLLPKEVRDACIILDRHHKQSYVVGGGIRDLILGMPPQDWDLATDARPREVERIFKNGGYKVVPTGVKYGTVTVTKNSFPLEITTFRMEAGYRDYRRPSRVNFVLEIEEDLGRRDFTINALAYDPLRSFFCDPYQGIPDLIKEQIRAVRDPEERFSEDPLRMLRAVRIAAELGFSIEDKTMHAMIRNAELLGKISSERIRDELNRLLMATHFHQGLENLLESGLLFVIIPELKEGWLFSQYHPSHQYPVLPHTLESMRYTPSNLEVRLAILLHDVAKPRCYSRGEDGRGHFYGHNVVGAEMTEEILRRLHYSNQVIKNVVMLVREHMLELKMGPAGIRRLVARVGREMIPALLSVRLADILAHSRSQVVRSLEEYEKFSKNLEQVMATGSAFVMRELAVNGSDIIQETGISPGPLVGKILRHLWEKVLDDPRKNNRDYLLSLAKRMVNTPG